MRKKDTVHHVGVADGLNFNIVESDIDEPNNKQISVSSPYTSETPINTSREYSPYYRPNPKTGAKGGTLGRPAVAERKKAVSIYCTDSQKQRYEAAALKDHRKLQDFFSIAIEEYIANHNL